MKKLCLTVALMGACVFARSTALIDRVPAPAADLRNPYEHDDAARRAGAKLFAYECAACHGPARAGIGKAPPLNQLAVTSAPPGKLFWILRNGSLAAGMPSFAHLPEQRRWQIVTFLKETH